jgi:hypothetical protein
VKNEIKKINITKSLKKGLYSILIYGNEEEIGEIADRVRSDHPELNRREVVESIEDAWEFIRQLAIGKNGLEYPSD